MRSLLVAAVFAGSLGWISPRTVDAASIVSRLGVEYDSYSFETYLGAVDISQTRIPLDLSGRSGETAWTLGFDFGGSDAEDWTGSGSLSGPAALRAGASREFSDGRYRLSGSALISLTTGPYSSDERLLLGWVSRHELGLPLPLVGQGNRYRVDASASLWSSRSTAVFAGGFAELQSAFEYRDDGLELDPSESVGAGVGIERGWSEIAGRLQLFLEHPMDGRIDGSGAYELGDRLRLRTEAETRIGSGRGRASAEILSVGSGELLPGWVLESTWIRGGNRTRWSLSWEKETRSYWGGGIGGTHHRGFTGALGHSDWVTPRLVLGRRTGVGDIRLDAAYRTGSVREGRSLDGAEIGLSWSREWTR